MRVATFTLLAVVLTLDSGARAQSPSTAQGEWPIYRGDLAGTAFSSLGQINTGNVATLVRAWTYRFQIDAPPTQGAGAAPNSQATPIVVGGKMYLPALDRVVALDPATGKELWQSRVTSGVPSRRGVAYWPGDANLRARIIFTAGRRLIALRAETGASDPAFGQNGEVDLVIPYNSVPLIFRNIVVVGGNSPPGVTTVPGNARAYDARTGAKLWEFNVIPRPGEVGHDTWEGDSWMNRGGVNTWPFYFTLDQQRELLFVTTGAPIAGPYGGDRKGANLYANSVIAIEVATGRRRWHFQTIHHDLWDADPGAAPGLIEITQGGRSVPALALTTKSGYLYLLNRETGTPIFGVEERAVAASDVPGEQTSPTQPFPVKPPPLARNSYSAADQVTAADTNEEHARDCRELIETIGGVRNSGPFTPWLYRAEGAPPRTTLVFPGMTGGINWGGTAFDRRSGYIYLASQDLGVLGFLGAAKAGSAIPYERTGPDRRTFDVPMPDGSSWPCQKPPWGRIFAINAATGDIVWQQVLGVTDQLPAGKQNTGRPLLAGPIVTAGGLLFIAATDDNRFRALDAGSGKELWVARLDRRGNANPMTYQAGNGKQYVAVAATDSLVVYTLP